MTKMTSSVDRANDDVISLSCVIEGEGQLQRGVGGLTEQRDDDDDDDDDDDSPLWSNLLCCGLIFVMWTFNLCELFCTCSVFRAIHLTSHSFAHSFIHSLNRSIEHYLNYSFIHEVIQCVFTHSFRQCSVNYYVLLNV